jgi:hypothetical protein
MRARGECRVSLLTPVTQPRSPGRGFLRQLFVSHRMSEIDRPANAKPVTESALTEIRPPRLLRLSPDMLREMAERTRRTKELGGSDRQSLRQPGDADALADGILR